MNRRVAIIGNAGGGKTTLARELASTLGIEQHSIDDVQWLPGWQRTPLDIVASRHDEWIARPTWVIDGWGAWDIIERRFELADTIVFIDFALVRHVLWAMRRHVRARLGRNPGWPPPGCEARGMAFPLLRVMWLVHTEWRPRLLRLLESPRFAGRIVRLRTPRELARFRDAFIASALQRRRA